MTKLLKLALDFENPATEWWDAGGRDLWEGIAEGFDTSQVVVEESLAQSWLAEAAVIPGWDSGPDFAPHPIICKEVDPDEDV